MPKKPQTVLVTLTGKDQPGVTAAMFTALSDSDVDVIDVEQIVLRGRLTLGFLLSEPADPAALEVLINETSSRLGMQTEIVHGVGDTRHRHEGRSRVTALGQPLRPRHMATIASRIASIGGNIDRIRRIARYPVTAISLSVSGADPAVVRATLTEAAGEDDFDVAVEASGLHRRGPRLVVMDVDSTLIQGEVIEMLAAEAGCEAEVARVTDAAMRGELDFAEALVQRVALLEGLDEGALDRVYDRLVITPGARTTIRTLRRIGYRFAIVSGGFTHLTERLAEELGIDYHIANELEIVDGRLTGRVVGEIVDRAGKAKALEAFAEAAGMPLSATIAIGDGANDLDMLAAAGLGIAFNAKPVVRESADTAVNVPYMDTVLYLLGITRSDVEAADASDGLVTPEPPIE